MATELSKPRHARIGKRSLNIVASSETDSYFQHVGDGIEDGFDLFCAKHLNKDSVVALDIGANIGITAAILSQHLPNGQVYAFEPGPGVFRALSENVLANRLSNVEPINAAMSDAPGEIRFAENSAYGHIVSAGGIAVPSLTVDDFVKEHKLDRIDLIKIDVEGFEPSVFRGAAKTIRTLRPLIYMEFNSWCLTAYSRENPLTFLEWIFDNFESVSAVERAPEVGLRRLAKADAFAFLHTNMTKHGFLDDLVLR